MIDLNYQFAKQSRLQRPEARLLTIDRSTMNTTTIQQLVSYLPENSVLVVNDAATIPGMIPDLSTGDEMVELRLMLNLDIDYKDMTRWRAIVLGAGTWRTPTEHRPKPVMKPGDLLTNQDLRIEITAVDEEYSNLVDIRFVHETELVWDLLYTYGKPIQYSHLTHELELWDTQTLFSSRPGALEPPSAAFQITWTQLDEFAARGIEIIPITHFTSISSTGVDGIDAYLPFDEVYHVSVDAEQRLNKALEEVKEIIAVGTSITRAIEDQYGRFGHFVSGKWKTSLRLSPKRPAQLVNWLLTGMHLPTESHMDLLRAFTSDQRIHQGYTLAAQNGFLWHEYGDICLLHNEMINSSMYYSEASAQVY